jgi:integrase
MKGKVRTREKCPKCGKKFQIIEEVAIICSECKTRPNSYFIFLYWEGNKYRLSRDPDGKIFRSYQDAYHVLQDIRKDILNNVFNISNYLPKEIDQFRGKVLLEKWFMTKRDKAPKHQKEVRRLIDTYYLPAFYNLDCRQLRTHHIETFYLSLPEHLSQKTKKNIMTMLKNFCNWLYRAEIIARVPIFPVVKVDEKPVKWISKEDQLRILEYIPKDYKPIFQFMFFHPVRPGEARALKVKDFNIDKGVVLISKTWSLNTVKERKNKKPYYLPISQYFDTSCLKGKHPEAFAFTNRYGRPFSETKLREAWHKARKKAGIPHITLYQGCRHSIASQAINAGVSLDVISKALGHSTIEMTKRYATMEIEMVRSVIDGAQVVQIGKNSKHNPLKIKEI